MKCIGKCPFSNGPSWREETFGDQFLAEGDAVRIVHSQQLNRDPTNRRSADKVRSIPTKMAIPFVPSGIEEAHEFGARCRAVNSRQVGTLMTIAMQAGKRKVTERCRPTMLPGDDVLDLVRTGMARVRQPTVFAAMAGAFPYRSDEHFIHDASPRGAFA